MFRLIPVMDQTHLSFQRGQEAWLAEFEKWWGRNNEAALVARPTLRVQSNAEIPRAHGQRIMCDLVGVGITEKGSWGIAVPKILERARETSPAGRCHHGVAACSDLGPSGVVWHFCVCPLSATLCTLLLYVRDLENK